MAGKVKGVHMLIYCDVEDCKHNEDGMCNCVWPNGVHAVKIHENYMGIPNCTDFKQREDQEEEEC